MSAYHDRELSPDEAAQVAAHLADCSSCAEELTSFVQLSGLSRRLTDPPVPAHLWEDVQSKLRGTTRPFTMLDRFAWNHIPSRLIALAATILVAVGIGVVAYNSWFSDGVHDHLAMNFAEYLKDFRQSPEAAQQILLANYNGRPITLNEATTTLGYEPLAAKGLPQGYSFDKAYLLDMPCCTCAQIVCKNKEGESIAIFEHDIDQPVWFGDRPTVDCLCHDVPTSVIQFGDRLAATWKEGERHVTIIGATDLDEVTEFVASFKSLSNATSG
jgi:hypothetical protein